MLAVHTINNPVFYLRLAAADLRSFYGITIIQRRIGAGPDHKFQQVAPSKKEKKKVGVVPRN